MEQCERLDGLPQPKRNIKKQLKDMTKGKKPKKGDKKGKK